MARPCLCGAPDCEDCGPAQGYVKCKLHSKYACSSCEEFFREHGYYPEADLPEPEEEEP